VLKNDALQWAPAYKVRYSKRAKNLSLRVTSERKLELVIPRGVSEQAAMSFFVANRAWVERNNALIDQREQKPVIPRRIEFPICRRSWVVEHMPLSAKSCICKEVDGRLLLCSKVINDAGAIKALRVWLRKKASIILPQRLSELSQQLALEYSKVSIRGQRCIWGSCSADAAISLNEKLLFLPIKVVDYVLIHELCHIKHPNHSQSFWGLLSTFMPDFRVQIKILRSSEKHLPLWVRNR